MIDSIGTSTSAAPRTQSTGQVTALRVHPNTLNTITQSQQKKSASVNPVLALAVPQGTKSGNSSTARLPRGSLVDQLV